MQLTPARPRRRARGLTIARPARPRDRRPALPSRVGHVSRPLAIDGGRGPSSLRRRGLADSPECPGVRVSLVSEDTPPPRNRCPTRPITLTPAQAQRSIDTYCYATEPYVLERLTRRAAIAWRLSATCTASLCPGCCWMRSMRSSTAGKPARRSAGRAADGAAVDTPGS